MTKQFVRQVIKISTKRKSIEGTLSIFVSQRPSKLVLMFYVLLFYFLSTNFSKICDLY